MDARTNTLLKRVDDALANLRAHLSDTRADPGWSRDEQRKGAVLSDVLAANGRVTVDAWREIGLRHRYHPSGLSGYFTGGVPSMRSDGDDRVLTDRGRQVAEDWRRLYGEGSK